MPTGSPATRMDRAPRPPRLGRRRRHPLGPPDHRPESTAPSTPSSPSSPRSASPSASLSSCSPPPARSSRYGGPASKPAKSPIASTPSRISPHCSPSASTRPSIEPHLTLHAQRLAWCCGFALFALLSAILALKTRSAAISPQSLAADDPSAPPAPLSHKILWVLLPMGAAMQLSAVTSYLTANVAAIPLLWILPLGVYLLTLILAFQFRVLLPWGIIARFMVVMLGGLAYSLVQDQCHLAAVALHSLLSRRTLLCLHLLPFRGLRAAPAARIGSHAFLSALRRRRRPRLVPRRHCRAAGVQPQSRSAHHLPGHRPACARRQLARQLEPAPALDRRQRRHGGPHLHGPHRLPARHHRRRPQLLRQPARQTGPSATPAPPPAR